GTAEKLAVDFNALEKIYQNPAFAPKLQAVNLDEPYLFLSNFIMEGETVRQLTEDQPINTDDHPIIEFTNPILADDFAARGQENLLQFNALTDDILPYLKLTDADNTAADLKTKLAAAQAEIREFILKES